jgi:agmatinase
MRWPTFLDTPPDEADLSRARVALIPVPYDGTSSYRTGARDGPTAIVGASRHLEDYDLELDRDVSAVGIHTAPAIEPDLGRPELLVAQVREAVHGVALAGKLAGLLGGEHTIAIGAVQALSDLYSDLSVLYLDAHADMRDEFMGTRYGHASVARRIHDICPLVEVGVRSVSLEERDAIRKEHVPVLFWTDPRADVEKIAQAALESLSSRVYVSVDLDVLDSSIMAAVGTPEPGGMDWDTLTGLLRTVGDNREIVGFDVSELSPDEGPEACAFTAAKLVYKLIAYATIR